MSDQYPVTNNSPIDKWRVRELREELRRRKLKISGVKAELVKRLDEAINEEKESRRAKVEELTVDTNQVKLNEVSSSAMEKDNNISNLDLSVASLDETSRIIMGESMNGNEGFIPQSESESNNSAHDHTASPVEVEEQASEDRLISDGFDLEPKLDQAENVQATSLGKYSEMVNLHCNSSDESTNDEFESDHTVNSLAEVVEKADQVHSTEEGASVTSVVDGGKEDGFNEEETATETCKEETELESTLDNEPTEKNLKRKRRWYPDNIKGLELQTSNVCSSVTPNNAFQPASELTLSRCDSKYIAVATEKRYVPLSSDPATTTLKIEQFVRPFTLKAVEELLAKTGTVCSFWMDENKTHGFVTYSSVEEAIATQNALHNLEWPKGGQPLVAHFVDPDKVELKSDGSLQLARSTSIAPPQPPLLPTPPLRKASVRDRLFPPLPLRKASVRDRLFPPLLPLIRKASVWDRLFPPLPPLIKNQSFNLKIQSFPSNDIEETRGKRIKFNEGEPAVRGLKTLFKRTNATPMIYYLQLSEEQVQAKLAHEQQKANKSGK